MSVSQISRGYAIGEMSRISHVNIETIRYYERISLLPKPDRTVGGNRQYNHGQLKLLCFIKKCRDLGFALDEIRAFMRMVEHDDLTCSEVHQMTISHLENVQEKLAALKKIEKTLKEMSAQCNRGDIPDCPIIDKLFDLDQT